MRVEYLKDLREWRGEEGERRRRKGRKKILKRTRKEDTGGRRVETKETKLDEKESKRNWQSHEFVDWRSASGRFDSCHNEVLSPRWQRSHRFRTRSAGGSRSFGLSESTGRGNSSSMPGFLSVGQLYQPDWSLSAAN